MAVEVIYFDESEANLAKEAKSFSDMQYDDEAANGAYGKLEEIQKKVGEITQTVESLESGYTTLKGKYDTFTGFDDAMDRNTRLFKSVILNIEDKYQKLDKAIHEEVDEQVKLDTEHNEEIEELTQALNNEEAEGEGGDTPAGGGGETTPTTEPTAGGDTPTTDPAAGGETPSGKSAADIADEVIQGKWGSGDERKAALEAAGYDPAEVQKIVNQKVNGTYTGDTPAGGGGGGGSTPATETPATETPTSGGGGGGGTTNPAAGEEAAPAPAVSPTFVGGGTSASDAATAAALGITPEQLDVVKATIRHEAGNSYQAMADVASCVKQRMNVNGADAYSVITSKGQFQSYGKGYYQQYTGGNYYQGDAATGASVDEMLNGILLGTTPQTHTHYYFYGDGKQNHFYD